jgi:CheY-like chemotaxis protein
MVIPERSSMHRDSRQFGRGCLSGEGSCLYDLPAGSGRRLLEHAMHSTEAMLRANRPLVLIVEPSCELRELFSAYFESAGYRVDVATNGEEALQKVNAAYPDAVVIETRLERLDGYALCRQLRQEPALPIVIVTTAASRSRIARAYDAGANVVITKPCFPDEIVAAVQRLMRVRSSQNPRPRR